MNLFFHSVGQYPRRIFAVVSLGCVALLVFGTLLQPALEAAQALNLTVVNMRWAKPLDTELLMQVAASHQALVTLEEGAVQGGAGSAVAEALHSAGLTVPVMLLGLRDEFTTHGDPARLLAMQGLDAAGIQASVAQRFGTLLAAAPPTLKVVA